VHYWFSTPALRFEINLRFSRSPLLFQFDPKDILSFASTPF